jgi:hypothetical protein
LEAELSPLTNSYKQYELLHSNHISKLNCTLVDRSNDDASIGSSHCTLANSSFTNHCTQLTNHKLWNLYFDTSKNMNGEDAGFLLVDLYGIQTYLAYHLESKCTEIDAEYEDLIQGFMKSINLKVKGIEVFGDSRLVIKHVRNSMFWYFLSPQQLLVRGMDFDK